MLFAIAISVPTFEISKFFSSAETFGTILAKPNAPT